MPPKRTHDDVDTVRTRNMATDNAPARGRKRFLFDLQNATQIAAQGVEVQGLRLSGKERRLSCGRDAHRSGRPQL